MGYHDWRTLHRLHLFNYEANRIMHNKKLTLNDHHPIHSSEIKVGTTLKSNVLFDIVPAFTSTLPFADKMCDNAHYKTVGSTIPQYLIFMKYLLT